MLTPVTDGFIAVADHHGVHLSKHERFPEDRVHIIRNGVDCERFSPSAEARVKLRAELGVDEETKLVGIVAALRSEKNHAMFVDVAKNVLAVRNDVHFVVVGDGPERPMIEALIAQYGIGEHLHLLGTRHDADKIVAGLDLFLLCSHNEASPVSILEALACEVPVVSTRVGSVAESVIDGETGFLVDVDNRAAMTARVQELLGDAAKSKKMGRKGRDLVLETGSLDAMVEGYTTLIEWIFANKQGQMPGRPSSAKVAPVSASSLAVEEVH
jgi:glycosyltransferase involved in cell wall biosynthesis